MRERPAPGHMEEAMQRHQSIEDRFWAKVEAMPSGCWEWRAAHDPKGYGVFRGEQSILVKAYKFSYELLCGPVPAGLQIDHLCRNPGCVNPDHMEPVTAGVNIMRGVGPTAVNAAKTSCCRGHLFTPENVYLYHGRRYCRACRAKLPLA